MVLASLAGLVGAILQTRLSPVADAAAVDERLYVTALWIIQNQVEESALHLGVVAALFITMPYGKFAHMVYRYAALVRNAIEAEREVETA